MKNTKNIWIIWAVAYVICTVCAFFPASNDAASGLYLLLSLGFFVPPAALIYKGVTKKWPKILRVIRNLSIISLASTLVMILLNFVSVQLSEIAKVEALEEVAVLQQSLFDGVADRLAESQ